MASLFIDTEKTGRSLGCLFGLFFEDLNHAADGGLYGELLNNRSFEACALDHPDMDALTGWKVLEQAKPEVLIEKPRHPANPHYIRIAGRAGSGIMNLGYGSGIPFDEGASYRLYLWVRGEAGTTVNVSLCEKDSHPLQSRAVRLTGDWQKAELAMTAPRTIDGALSVTLSAPGWFELDMVSLFPQDTFMGRENGLRKDIAEALRAMKPRFLRFPGGCLTHDGQLDASLRDGMYRWKNTVGPVDERPVKRNSWGYPQSLGLGFYEYFCLCEDIGAKPLPVVSGGCDPHHKRFAEGETLERFIQDALDLIEFANGDMLSPWGSLRAAMGHPAPFDMRMICIGNEEVHQEFYDRLPLFVRAIRERYPEVMIVGTAGPFCAGSEYERGWRSARTLALDFVDEHYYMAPEWFMAHADRYLSYSPEEPRVMLGEYASWGSDWKSALAEAVYMIQMQNAPAVGMACYAPMLCNVNYVNWRPNMLFFDQRRLMKTPSYYVQALFMRHQGEQALESHLEDVRKAGQRPNPGIAGHVLIRMEKCRAALTGLVVADADGHQKALDDLIMESGEEAALFDASGNFTLTMTARRLAGTTGFKVLFGYENDDNFLSWSFGGWENQDSLVEKRCLGRGSVLTQSEFSIETGKAYQLKLEVRHRRIRAWIDGLLFNDTEDLLPWPECVYTAVSRVQDSIIIKAVNPTDDEQPLNILMQDLSEDARFDAVVEELVGYEPGACNELGQDEAVHPSRATFTCGRAFSRRLPPRSVHVLVLTPTR